MKWAFNGKWFDIEDCSCGSGNNQNLYEHDCMCYARLEMEEIEDAHIGACSEAQEYLYIFGEEEVD